MLQTSYLKFRHNIGFGAIGIFNVHDNYWSMETYRSLADALEDLKRKGYEADFTPDADCLYAEDLDIRLDPDDFRVDAIYRFGHSTGKGLVLYAVSSVTGVKGTIVDSGDD